METRFIDFLKEELAIPEAAIAIAKRGLESDPRLLPMQLWQYGLINLQELDRIFDWLETA